MFIANLAGAAAEGKQQERRYSGGQCCGTITGTVCGEPDPDHVSTSFVARRNSGLRMGHRRFTRLTDGFSRKVDDHAPAPAIYCRHYNCGRSHQSLRVTPAMAAGISDHVWRLEEIAAPVVEPVATKRGPGKKNNSNRDTA